MAILFCDGFDGYAATADLTKKWVAADASWAWVANQGRKGRGAIVGGSGDANLLTSPGGWNASALAIGFYLKVMSRPTGIQELVLFQPATDITDTEQNLRLDVHPVSGSVRMYFPGVPGVELGGTVNVCDNQFHWVEVLTGIGTGAVHKLWIDNAYQNELTVDIPASYGNIDHIQISTLGTVISIIDDLIVYNNTAPAPILSATPLGSREITTLRPSGDAAVQFMRSSGSVNSALVADVAADEDATYVEDGVSGHQDLYNFVDLAIAPQNITAVVVNSRVKNGGPVGSVSFSEICKSGTNQAEASAVAAPANYKTFQHSFSVDPQTSLPWTITGFNAATFGIKVA